MNKAPELPLSPPLGLPTIPTRGIIRMPSKLDDILQEELSCITQDTIEQREAKQKPEKTRKKSSKDGKGDIASPGTKRSKKKAKQKKARSNRGKDDRSSSHKSLPCGKLMEELAHESSTSTEPVSEQSQHSRSSRSRSRRNSTGNSTSIWHSGTKKKSRTCHPATSPALDSYFHTSITDQSVATADTEPSTPYAMKKTVDPSRQLMGIETNIDVSTMPTTNFPTISEEEPITSKKQESKAKKEAKRERETKKDNKKKSKKDKKKKSKTKDKKVKKKGKGMLSKHFESSRSVGSFGSQRSFGSQSLGSYVSERGGDGESFVSFVSIKQHKNKDDLDSSAGRLGIRKRAMPKGSRKVPLVSMPEHSLSPDQSRKAFNDNVLGSSNHSLRSFRKSSDKAVSPTPFSSLSPKKPLQQQLSMTTPISLTESVASPKIQMIPKSQSFSFRNTRMSLQSKVQSAPSFSEAIKRVQNKNSNKKSIRTQGDNKNEDFKKKNLPMTKYCSAPKATHPNKSVAKAWVSPFETEVKYVEPETETFEPLKGFSSGMMNSASTETTDIVEEDAESEHSDVEDLWESYAPSALIQKKDNNVQGGHNNRSSLSYDHDDDRSAISALTMSARTDESRGVSPRRSRGKTISENRAESPRRGTRVRPRSTTPSRSPIDLDDVEQKGASLQRNHSLDTSGEEGSVSLHDSSVRTSSPVDKTRVFRPRDTPTVPRYHTPPRIRFGEGQSDPNSPRLRDQSPCVPKRLPSRHDREDEDNTVSGRIPVVLPNLFESEPIREEETNDYDRDRNPEDKTTKVIDDYDDGSDNDESDSEKDNTAISPGVCDDADAAAGKSSETKKLQRQSLPKSPGRVNHLIQNFEAMDGNCVPIQSRSPSSIGSRSPSSIHKRKPKNLQPIPPEARGVPATMMLCRSPSLPSPKSPGNCGRAPPRNSSSPLLPSFPKDADENVDSVCPSPRAKKSPTGRTKMAVKAMKPSAFDSSAHSSVKEAMQGNVSDWTGSPKKFIRDASYKESSSGSEQPATSRRRSKTGKDIVKAAKAAESPMNRRKSTGKNDAKPERRRSTGKNEPKPERRKSTGKNEPKPERRRSTGKNEPKPERRRSTTGKNERRPEIRSQASPRRRSITPDKFNRGDKGPPRSPRKTKPSSFKKKGTGNELNSTRNTKPSSFEKQGSLNEPTSPRKIKLNALRKKGTGYEPASPRNTKPPSFKKKGNGYEPSSPRKTKPASLRKNLQATTVDGATGIPVEVSQHKTPIQRVRRMFGQGLLGLTPGSTHSRRGNKVHANYLSPRVPDLPLTITTTGDIPPMISPRRSPSNSPGRSRSPSQLRNPSRTNSPSKLRPINSPTPPPPKSGFFSKARFKERAYLQGSRGEWGGEKAKLQRKREKDKKIAKDKTDALGIDDLQQ